MRWLIFVGFYVLIGVYGFQSFRTISRSPWAHGLYIVISLLVLGYFIYQWTQPNSDMGFSGAKGYALGLMLAVISGMIILSLFMFGEDIWRVLFGLYRKLFTPAASFEMPSRRKFLSQLALGIAAVPFASLLYGMYKGKYNFRVFKYSLYFEDLPEAFNGYRITQLSDIHSGSFDNREKIEYAVNLVNLQESDAVLFTGDLVNNIAKEMDPWKEVFSGIKARDGVFSVLGNHDYGDYVNWASAGEKAANFEAVREVHAAMGWELLMNDHRFIRRNGEKIAIVGVENWGIGGFKKNGDLEKAGKGLSPEEFKILLSHDPSHWQEKIKQDPVNYQLTLSGHTHGMQFGIEIPGWFRWSPVQYRYENWAGIYEEFGRYLNVNRGFGYLAYPGRVGIWPEITVIELRKGPKPV